MPAPELIANDVVVGVLKGTIVGQQVQNTFHWKVTNTVAGYNLSNLAQDMIDEMLPEYRLLMSEDWTAYSAYTRRITPNATRGIEIFTANDAGLEVSPALPPQVAVVCSRLTNAPRTARPRTHLPPSRALVLRGRRSPHEPRTIRAGSLPSVVGCGLDSRWRSDAHADPVPTTQHGNADRDRFGAVDFAESTPA